MLEGELTLVTNDGQLKLTNGMCVGFSAGTDNAHHLINLSDKPGKFLVIGSRVDNDEVVYPDDDFKWLEDASGEIKSARKDGSFY